MKRKLTWLSSVFGFAIVSLWSTGASAQWCVDPWGGCMTSDWWVGSAVNQSQNIGGTLSSYANQCAKDPRMCIKVTSEVTIPETTYPNQVAFCIVPGADTCTEAGCGYSPYSSGKVFSQEYFNQIAGGNLNPSSECSKKDRVSGQVKCVKTNTVTGPEAAAICPNGNWNVHWFPLEYQGTTKWEGPLSSKDRDTKAWLSVTRNCYYPDELGRHPSDPNYVLPTIILGTMYECGTQEQAIVESSGNY